MKKQWIIGKNGVYGEYFEMVLVEGSMRDLRMVANAPEMYRLLQRYKEDKEVRKVLDEVDTH